MMRKILVTAALGGLFLAGAPALMEAQAQNQQGQQSQPGHEIDDRESVGHWRPWALIHGAEQ